MSHSHSSVPDTTSTPEPRPLPVTRLFIVLTLGLTPAMTLLFFPGIAWQAPAAVAVIGGDHHVAR